MKNFLRRLKYYGIGFGLGLIFVFFFFKNRGCSWLPESRVKNTILGRVLVVPEADKTEYAKLGLSDDDIVQFLNDGDVDFGGSSKHGNPQVYSISKEIKGKEITLWFTLPKDAFISEVRMPKGSIQKVTNTKEGIGQMIHFPNVDNMVFLNEDPLFVKEQKRVGLDNAKRIMKYLKKSGKVNFEASTLKSNPYPIQKIRFTTPTNVEVEASSYWFEEHITIESFDQFDTLR